MSTHLAEWLVTTLTVYIALGATFAVPFLARWVGKLDAAAATSTWGFRVLVLPGIVILWPVFVARLLTGASGPRDEWTAHRDPRRLNRAAAVKP